MNDKIKFGKRISWEWREEKRIPWDSDKGDWNILYVPCIVNDAGEVLAVLQFGIAKIVRKGKPIEFQRDPERHTADIWNGQWTPPSEKPDSMPPCPAADILVAAYNGNIVREETLAELHEKCGKLANSFEDWEHRDYANALRNIVKEADANVDAAINHNLGKVCVIDDDRFMKSFCEKFLEDFEITHLYRLPEDESILAEFDVLVVDGQGIGNSKYKEGKDFLLSYKIHGSNRGCVYYSGLCDQSDREELAQHGIAAVTKGSDPQKLCDAVKGFFA